MTAEDLLAKIEKGPLLMKLPEAAAASGISERKLRQLARDGTIPSRRIGRYIRIPRLALAEYVAGAWAA